jgi:protein phosphatase
MGTTLTALHLDDTAGRYVIAHVGDSRAYRIREESLEQLTEDHSERNELKKLGVSEDQLREARPHIISRSVGTARTVEADIFRGELRTGDIFLLCTDGVTDVLSDDEIQRIILKPTNLEKAYQELMAQVQKRHGADDATALLVRTRQSI